MAYQNMTREQQEEFDNAMAGIGGATFDWAKSFAESNSPAFTLKRHVDETGGFWSGAQRMMDEHIQSEYGAGIEQARATYKNRLGIPRTLLEGYRAIFERK